MKPYDVARQSELSFWARPKDPGELLWSFVGDKIKIVRADPHIVITTDEMLHAIAAGSQHTTWEPTSKAVTVWDDFGAEFIYRVGDYDPVTNTWDARWPD